VEGSQLTLPCASQTQTYATMTDLIPYPPIVRHPAYIDKL